MLDANERILLNKCSSRNLKYISKKKLSKLVSKNKYLDNSKCSPTTILKNKKNHSQLNKIEEIHKKCNEKNNDLNITVSSKKLDEKEINLKEKSLNKNAYNNIYYPNKNSSLRKILDNKKYCSNNDNSSDEKKEYNKIREKKETSKKGETLKINKSISYNMHQLNKNFGFKENNDIINKSNEIKINENNNKCLKSICTLKKLNGQMKKLNINEVNQILKNYVPYNTRDIAKSGKFMSKKGRITMSNNLEDLNSLPLVYEKSNLNINIELIKKCRDASKTKIINKTCLGKIPPKIKLPIQRNFKSLTDLNLKLKYGEHYLYKENEEKKRSITTFNYPSKNFRSFSCTNINYNKDNKRNKSREISQKSIFCNSEAFYTTPVGEAKLCGFENEFLKLKSVEKEKVYTFHPSQVKHSKTIISPNLNSIKQNLTSMVLKHSNNMIWSKLKKLKNKKINNSKYRSNSLVDDILEKTNFSNRNFLRNNEVESKIKDQKEKNKVSCENKGSFLLNYNKNLNQSKNLIHRETKYPFRTIEQDLILAEILAEKTRVKSIEKKKIIEKISDYKVIYNNEDLVSIYKNNEDKEKKEQFIDVTSLLCKPGYIGNYLCETASTINLSYIKKRKEEDKNRKITDDNDKNNEFNEKIKDNNTSCNNEYYINENIEKIENEKKNEEEIHIKNEFEKYRNIYELNENENDEILAYLKESIKNSPTVNVDLQYIMIIFNEILEKEKTIKYKKELLFNDRKEIDRINQNKSYNLPNNHYSKFIQKGDNLKKSYINYNTYDYNLSY